MTSITYIWFHLIEKSDVVRQASERIMAIRAVRVLFINWRNALELRASFADWETCFAGGTLPALGSLAKAFCQMQNPHNKQFSNYIPRD